MATGTPVVAYRAGSVPEVVEDGVTGFVCDSLRDMVDAVARIPKIDRRACRSRVERYFSSDTMACGYERVYRLLIEGERGTVAGIDSGERNAAAGMGE